MEVCISLRDVGIKALDANAEVEEVEVQSQCPSFSDERCIDELKDSSCAPPSVLSKDSGDDPVIDALVKSLQAIYDRGHSGINCDFMVVPHIHPHARIACEWVPPGSHNGHVWHIFTDGSAKKEIATWAIVIIKEVCLDGRLTYARVGYAAGEVNEALGPVDQNAMDAEATAIIAMVEYAIANCVAPESHVYCHFDAMAVGFGATGVYGMPQRRGSTSTRQKAARILMTVLERRMEQQTGVCKGSTCVCTSGPSLE